MAPIRDPEGFEAKYLLHAGQLHAREVLEIGCGNGWLTWQFAHLARKVIGIDPGFSDLQEAKTNQPTTVVSFYLAQSMGESLPLQSEAFDRVVFSNSL